MEGESLLEKLANKAADNVSATFSKVTTRVWPVWDMEQADTHVPIIWLMHDLSFPTVFSVRVNNTEVHRSQHEKEDLPPVFEVPLFSAAGREVKVSVTCKPVSSWVFTSFEYIYKCEIDGLELTENAATEDDPAADRLAAQQLHTRVSVPTYREVPAKRDPTTGLAATKELTVEYQSRLELEDGSITEQWHRFSHFTNMHAALCSCLAEDSPALATLPQLPPKSWGLNGYDAGKAFLEERRKGLDTYMKQIMQSPIKASRNPYILGLFGLLKPLRQSGETQPTRLSAAPPVDTPEPASEPEAADSSAASAPVPAPARAAEPAEAPAVASTPPAISDPPLPELTAGAPAVVAAESLDDLPVEDDVDNVEGEWM